MHPNTAHPCERRCGLDRRTSHSVSYFIGGGAERRRGFERRSLLGCGTGWRTAALWPVVKFPLRPPLDRKAVSDPVLAQRVAPVAQGSEIKA